MVANGNMLIVFTVLNLRKIFNVNAKNFLSAAKESDMICTELIKFYDGHYIWDF